jgi:hypothetical protein
LYTGQLNYNPNTLLKGSQEVVTLSSSNCSP